jgi:hypothetical protein
MRELLSDPKTWRIIFYILIVSGMSAGYLAFVRWMDRNQPPCPKCGEPAPRTDAERPFGLSICKCGHLLDLPRLQEPKKS